MNNIGNNIKITFFGESHGEYLGIVIDQLPAGLKIDTELLDFNLTKRRPKKNISTPRIEKDNYKIVSGFHNGYTTGGALTFLVPNENVQSKSYQSTENIPRPSHADYPASIKYKNFNVKSGGGFFSGRLTVLWTIIGSISQQILEKKNIFIGSHINSIKNIYDNNFELNNISSDVCKSLNEDIFPVLNKKIKTEMLNLIKETKNDSLGGTIESAIVNLPIGIGEPLFLSVESYLSQLLFSVPAIKGIEFGKGFEITKMYGSNANDEYTIKENNITTLSNNNGGLLGGLSTGRPVVLRCAIKPTPSIAKKQHSVNLQTKENTELVVNGRHDPQIVSRIVHVINSVLNFAILDLLLFENKDWV
ncbi:MAG: chorismate synthase [Candidatus Izimaplasma sp.]|nr:chorismate synthase [Candidatus Izimaplasma bacterium]